MDDDNDMAYFINLLGLMREILEDSSRIPLSRKGIVDVEQCLDILNDMDRNLPIAIQYGLQMYSERERVMGIAEDNAMNKLNTAEMRASSILENAKAEAKQILEDAREDAESMVADAQARADKLVSDDEIVARAREEASIAKNDARVEINELRLKANHDEMQIINGLEDQLSEALNSIQRIRADLNDRAE